MTDHPAVTAALHKLDQGDAAGAIALLTEALASEPDAAELYFYRGQFHANADDPASALADFDRALALAPAMDVVRQRRAEARIDAGDHAGAIADYTELLAAGALGADRRFDYLAHRGQLYVAEGRYGEAVADFDAALGIEPEFFTLHFLRGEARWLAGDVAGAGEDIAQGLSWDPEDAGAWCLLGRLHQSQGDPEGALTAFEQALALEPENATARQGADACRAALTGPDSPSAG